MVWKVEFDPAAERDLDRLDPQVARRISLGLELVGRRGNVRAVNLRIRLLGELGESALGGWGQWGINKCVSNDIVHRWYATFEQLDDEYSGNFRGYAECCVLTLSGARAMLIP